jgi:predicted amidohydrolase
MAARGATALFVPTNTGLPPAKAYSKLFDETMNADMAMAVQNRMWVIRADVAGRTDTLVAYGASGIVGPDGGVVQSARKNSDDLIIAEVDTVPSTRR